MCGIAGITAFAGSLRSDFPDLLKLLSQSLASRGPDADGVWTSDGRTAALVHRRLSIIDVDERANQPMQSADGRFSLVFNGEIYNYKELKAELQRAGRVFTTTSDSEVLLQMYIEYGTPMLHRLRGMYAFAIWDEGERKLFMARDPLGIKPLYYSIQDDHLYFASQVRALRGIPGMDLRPEPAGCVGFFVWGSVPEPYTLFRGIRCLPSGSFLTVANGNVSTPKRFASPVEEFLRFEEGERPKHEEECFERLREALKESVKAHLIADVPVSIFLSGGIDSGTIASLAAEAHGGLEGLTLGFDRMKGTPEDETQLAAEVAKHNGLRHHVRYIGRETFMAHRQRLMEQMDQPTIDGVNTYFVSLLARERGYKVALSGLGGDELFGGYPSFRQIPPLVHGLSVSGSYPRMGPSLRHILAPALAKFTSPKYASLFEYGGSWGGAYLLRRGLFLPWELPGVLDGEMVRDGWSELASISEMNARTEALNDRKIRPQSNFLHVSALEMEYYLRTQLLRDADWAGMAHSVEIRVPMVDMELLRQLAPLRASPFFPKKPHVVEALHVPLPKEVIERPKTGFVVPVRKWMEEELEGTPMRGLRDWAVYIYRYFQGLPSREAAFSSPV